MPELGECRSAIMSWTPRPRASIAISNATTQKWQDKTQNHAEPTKAPNAGRSGKIENSVISVGTCRQIKTQEPGVGWHCNGVGKPFAKRSQEKIYNPDAAKKHGSLVLGRGGFRISGQSPKLPMCRSSLHNYILHVCEETWSIHNNLQRIPMRRIRTVWVGLRFVCQNNNPFWPPEPAPKHDWFRNRETNCFVKTFIDFCAIHWWISDSGLIMPPFSAKWTKLGETLVRVSVLLPKHWTCAHAGGHLTP